MLIQSLEGKDFRNYETLSLTFGNKINLFYGDNAQGKTNILEAIYLMGTTKSHKGSKDYEMLRFSQQEAHLRMKFKKNDVLHQIDISPEDLNIVKNSPGERRRFMDMELCQLDKTYLYAYTCYKKVLQQRNSILKQAYYRKDLLDTLEVWN